MSQRLFVGNLPIGTIADDLKQEFSAYGFVKGVELKIKENLVDAENPNIFAFVTLDINRKMIKQSIDEFSQQQYRGRYLNVSVARESFLDRLKRERKGENLSSLKKCENFREETGIANPVELTNNDIVPPNRKLTSFSSESESVTSDYESELEKNQQQSLQNSISSMNGLKKSRKEEVEEELFTAERKASSSLQNEKIKIQYNKNEPIYVISKKTKDVKQLDEKARISDLKRKESLIKMKNQYNQQKLTIQKALMSVDTNKCNKIVFNDGENGNNEKHEQANQKLNLFKDADDGIANYEKDFKIKNQYEGKCGEKLIKLQTKFRLDSRFQMDERFLDDDEDEKVDFQDDVIITNDNNERKWQLEIIEEVIGRKLAALPESHEKKKLRTMLRYDPAKEDQKFVKNVDKISDNTHKRKIESKLKENDKIQEIEVSKEQYYRVNANLRKSLNQKSDGFSLLSLFGHIENRDDVTNRSVSRNENNLNAKSSLIIKSNSHIDNTFKYDFSNSEAEDEDPTMKRIITHQSMEVDDDYSKTDKTSSLGSKMRKTGVWNENFFIFEKDQRLKAGVAFFKQFKKDGESEEVYDTIRDKLRLIIKRKIIKSRRNMKEMKTRKDKFRENTSWIH